MIALPSMIVLDFFEWLKTCVEQKQNVNCTDTDMFFDLVYSRDDGALRRYADEYLRSGILYRKILRDFIESEEFSEYFNRQFNYISHNELASLTRFDLTDIRHILHRFYNNLDWRIAFDRFLNSYFKDSDDCVFFNPDTLVDSVKYYCRYEKDNPVIMNFMTSLSTNLSVELDFLQWLIDDYGKPLDLNKMPIPVFEDLVIKYSKYANCSIEQRNKLVESFKKNDPISLSNKLEAVLTDEQAYKMKTLGYIYGRYSSKEILYRCFFLPLESDGERFEHFIRTNWVDLNEMTGDYLDVYYSEDDFGRSGYAIKNHMRMIPNKIPNILPSLVLWRNDLKEAEAICIDGLSERELVVLIATIVDEIKAESSFDKIIKEAKQMVEKVKKEHIDAKRPLANNTYNYHIDTNNGIVSHNLDHSNISIYSGVITDIVFESETQRAIDIINRFSEVEKEYRDVLISLLKEANTATQKKDEVAKTECKNKFKGFVLGAGKFVGAIIEKLSELATIAEFFGINSKTPWF